MRPDDIKDTLDENHWHTLQELLTAVSSLPGVYERIEAFMMGRGIADPKVELEALHDKAF